MRICVVSRRNATRDPAIRALANSLDSVGHEVTVVCAGTPEPGLPETVRVLANVATSSARQRLIRRLGGSATDKTGRFDAALRRNILEANPDLIYPHREEDVTLVDDLGVPVLRRPEWDAPTLDLIALAPHSIELSTSPANATGAFHPQTAGSAASTPVPNRYERESVVIAYRVTPTSPGRYLEAALRRSGASVTVLDGILDWDLVPSSAAFVVIVESPYPALEVHGTNPGVPVLFWVHHGEHHLAANLRLVGRYGANAVLLAHSWHLAHRFPVPVHRFPFASAPEMWGEPRPWSARTYDVALVGAGVGGSGGRYDRRRQLVESLEGEASIRTKFAYGLSPEEMCDVYGDTRVVINEGGSRHFPITMRVFEVLGAGALLLTEDLPGTDVLLRRDEHYAPMSDDVVHQAQTLLAAERSAEIADAGHEWVLGRHTYDHRVDQLFEIAGQALTDPALGAFVPATPLAALIDRDVEAQHVAVFGETGDLGLRDRAIRAGDVDRLRDASIDAIVIGAGTVTELDRAVVAARGYVYAAEDNAVSVQEILALHRPHAVISFESGILRADLGGTGYRMRPADHPLAL